jgi:SAM-dependent methyltransferase
MERLPNMVDHNSSPSRIRTSNAPVSQRAGRSVLAVANEATDDVADIYNQAGDDYVSYADGDPSQPFSFVGMHAYADRCVWALLETKLADLRASGASSVRFLDAGCGPGTWLRRLVIRARALGFTSITARGFDIAQAQIQRARLAAQNLASLPGVNITFDVADLTDRLPEPDASVDITLCLYSALSHLPVARLADISTEMARVTSGHFVTTVRPIGSTPTAFVESVDNIRRLKQDHVRDRCEIDLSDGRRMSFGFHLFSAVELRNHFASCFDIEDMRGLDLFHSRFMPDPRWNPVFPPGAGQLAELERLEKTYATSPEFMERAAHLLLVARSRRRSP